MREAWRRTRKDAAAGVDGVTAAQYEAELEANLEGLLERFKSGRYRAPAVRRVHLEKPGTSKTRPIGIEPGMERIRDANVPRSPRCDLLAIDGSVVEPSMDGRGCDGEYFGGLGDVDKLAICGPDRWIEARNVPVAEA